MPNFALIDTDGTKLRIQAFAERPDDPVGKGWRWVPVRVEAGAAGTPDRLAADAWIVTDPGPAPPTADAVKAEAYRRIVAICPEWKQRNLIAQATLLAEKGRANWTAQELADWDAGEAVWTRIKAVRDRSGTIEAMTPIPADFTDDKHWP